MARDDADPPDGDDRATTTSATTEHLANEDADKDGDETDWLLHAIVENIPHMLFVKDEKKLAFTLFNRAGEELLGLSRHDLLGKTDFDLFDGPEAASFQKKDRETLENKVLVDVAEEP